MSKFLMTVMIFSFLFSACSKSTGDTTVYPYYLNITINKVAYTTNSVASFGLTNEAGCVANKSFDLTNVGQFNVEDYFFDCYFKHYTNNSDFASTKPGTHKIFDGGDLLKSTQCNCDLIIGLVDNNIPNLYNNTILQPTNIVNTVTSITNISKGTDSLAGNIVYAVAGTFSCYFKNTNNVVIPVTGTYKMPMKEKR